MTEEEIKRYKKSRKKEKIEFDLFDDDARILNGYFSGMMLTDIYVIFPEYIDFIIGYDNAPRAIKMIAKQIKSDYVSFQEGIKEEIRIENNEKDFSRFRRKSSSM